MMKKSLLALVCASVVSLPVLAAPVGEEAKPAPLDVKVTVLKKSVSDGGLSISFQGNNTDPAQADTILIDQDGKGVGVLTFKFTGRTTADSIELKGQHTGADKLTLKNGGAGDDLNLDIKTPTGYLLPKSAAETLYNNATGKTVDRLQFGTIDPAAALTTKTADMTFEVPADALQNAKDGEYVGVAKLQFTAVWNNG